jgi:putative PIN family toxin of toxin-antitoxin system
LISRVSHPRIQEKYGVQSGDISALVNLLRLRGELVIPDREIILFRDPKDDKFLEVAVAGSADCLVTGDADLLILEAFEGIPILRVTEFLAQF